MRLALAFLMLVTMATAFNLRKQFRPKNDERTGNQVPNKFMNLYLKYNIHNKRLRLKLASAGT